jgi:hypothetical protein
MQETAADVVDAASKPQRYLKRYKTGAMRKPERNGRDVRHAPARPPSLPVQQLRYRLPKPKKTGIIDV